MKNSHRFFKNTDCQYFPCHDGMGDNFNCLFCFCPLYLMEENCGGNFTYIETQNGKTKDCTNCKLPHIPEYYDDIIKKLFS